MKHAKQFQLTFFAAILAFGVISLGAYTRLSDSGLGCPDWPGCYGQLTVPSTQDAIQQAEQLFPQMPIESAKAWTEMTHRYIAGCLALLILSIAFLSIKNQLAWKIPLLLVALVIVQALLGMWTVTLKLYPITVVAHLLGGLLILSGLTWQTMKLKPTRIAPLSLFSKPVPYFFALSCLLLLFLQLGLGGWTSANYAALACADFPMCNGQWIPSLDLPQAFNLFQAGHMGSPGTPLDSTAHVTIHFSHRMIAYFLSLFLIVLILRCKQTRHPLIDSYSNQLGLLLFIQLALGISNIVFHWPLWVAVLHNAGAALLLVQLLRLVFVLHAVKRQM